MQTEIQYASVRSIVILALLFLNLDSMQARSAPEILSLEEARKELGPAYNFSVNGIAFHQHKLFAGTGPGLLEISDGRVETIYRWDKTSTSVAFPAHDTANNLLWAQVSGLHQLAYLDGKGWRTVDRPKPKRGYVSRGDAWEGIRWASNRKTFYFQGGGHAWDWQGSKWIEQENPPTKTNEKNPLGLLDRLIVTDEQRFFVVRDESEPIRIWVEARQSIGVTKHFKGNSIYYFAQAHWNLITNSTTEFLSEETAALDRKGYIRTTQGDLLEVTEARIARLTTPGACEAIAPSETGTLLASFRGQGVYELTDQWHKLLPNPNPDLEGDFKVCLTASDQKIAISISPRLGNRPEMPTTNALVPIWISDGQKWRQVVF